MDTTAILTLLLHGNQLKCTARTGWVQRGVPHAENVAAHSYGVAFTALVLAQIIDAPLDVANVLAMAVLHDLPEGLTTDIPSPAWAYLPPGIKTDVERAAMDKILDGAPGTGPLLALWEALHAGESAEAKLVHDADKLDMLIQAVMYEEQTGNRQLSEFWEGEYPMHYAESRALYAALRRRRAGV